jgi:hypothetical protein
MKISVENNSKMVLEDNKLKRFATAILLFVGGLMIAVLFRKNLLPLAVGLAFAAVGVFLFLSTKRVRIELDKSIGKITILLKGFKQAEERGMAFGDIQKIVLRKLIQTSLVSNQRGRGQSTTYYQFLLILVTNRNEELPFDFGKVNAGLASMIFSPDSRKQTEAQQIASFIGTPLEIALPSASAVISAIKDRALGQAGIAN